jgi:type I restriction enzyme M protein
MRGWELPQRAKHFVEPGDIYIGGVWGSVAKWFIADSVTKNGVVTNGCYRLRVKKGQESRLIDLVAFLCTEAYAVQMRALSRGSDGLAEVHETDLPRVVIPLVTDSKVRSEIKTYVDALLTGRSTLVSAVGLWNEKGKVPFPATSKRPHHSVLV